ncbi:hypothetical protein vBBaMIFTN1_26 [Bordetella phage vB_BaM-IFTN1]|nr:hypothetical protein vBBaMIFTN1_26 [Bordetella phage vB_BaM-IFTN1]
MAGSETAKTHRLLSLRFNGRPESTGDIGPFSLNVVAAFNPVEQGGYWEGGSLNLGDSAKGLHKRVFSHQ